MRKSIITTRGYAFSSIILAGFIVLGLWILLPTNSAKAQGGSAYGSIGSELARSSLPAPLAQATPYTTTTSITQINSLHPDGIYMVGFGVEVTALVTNIGQPGNNSPTGTVDFTTDNGGPSCLNIPVSTAGARTSQAVCTLFFTNAVGYHVTADFQPDPVWLGSSDTSSTLPVITLNLSPSLSAGRLHSCSLDSIGTLDCWGLSDSFPGTPQTQITHVSAGGYQTCGIKTDGTLGCWGDNAYITTTVPIGTYIDISTGKDHVCAIGTDSLLNCWGDPQSLPMTTTVGLGVPSIEVKAVSAGNTYDCAIKQSDSTLACWGDPNPAWDTNKPTGPVKAVAVGEKHACVILASSDQVQCWGKYDNFSFGTDQFSKIDSGSDYACAQRSNDNTILCSGANMPPISGSLESTAFSSGFLHTCSLTDLGGYLDCAGDNSQGQAPSITLTPPSIPNYLPADRFWAQGFTITGGALPSELTLDIGTLPVGLQVVDLALEGTPSATGLYTFTLAADETFSNSILPYQLKPHQVEFTTNIQNPTIDINISVSPISTPAGSPVTVFITVTKTASPTISGSVTVTGTNNINIPEAGCNAALDPMGNSDCVMFFPITGTKTITARYVGDDFYLPSPEFSATVNIDPVVIMPAISAGSDFNCSLDAIGYLYCWGKNDSGQTIPPVGRFDGVSAGRSHACARNLNGQIFCWGWNGYGVSNPPATSGFISATSGATHACGLLYEGSAICWGNPLSGRRSVPAGFAFTQISAGDDHTCGLDGNGNAACWGVSSHNRTTPVGGPFQIISSGGTFTCGIQISDGSISCWGLVANPPSGTAYKHISAGTSHACAVRQDDSLVCWGDDTSGQASPPAGPFHSVSAGDTHTCGIRTDGFMLCWGDNNHNQAPFIEILPVSLPTIDIAESWNQPLEISGGRQQSPSYTITPIGTLPPGLQVDSNTGEISGTPSQPGDFTYRIQAIERNLIPALIGERTFTQTVRSAVSVDIVSIEPAELIVGKPVQVSVSVSEIPGNYLNISPTMTITVQTNHGNSCLINLSAGAGSCFLFFTTSGEKEITASYSGDANFRPGETTDPMLINLLKFSQPPALHTGKNRTLIHNSDGTLDCQGTGCPLVNLIHPFSIAGVYPFAGVGDATICVLQTDGQVRCQTDGEPAVVHPGQFTVLSVGSTHACAIDVYGAVHCWGDNTAGQSDGQVGPFLTVDAGASHTCGIHVDGSLFCWGSVPGLPPTGAFTALSAGPNHTCALSTAGSLSCWGDDTYGQSTPPNGHIFQSVSVGDLHTCGLVQDGNPICWGYGIDDRSTAPYGTFNTIASTDNHNCALREGLKQTCWGINDSGEAPQISVNPQIGSEFPAFLYWEHGFYPSGGQSPYISSTTDGTLPPGVQLGVLLSPAGVILYGTPEVVGVYPFTIRWEDSGTVPLVLELPFTMTVTGADLQVAIHPANPTTALFQNGFSFEYRVTNNTILSVPDIGLEITLPTGIDQVSSTGISGCSISGSNLQCQLNTLAPYETQSLTVTGQVVAPAGQVLSTTAQVQPQLVNWPEVAVEDNTDSLEVEIALQFLAFNDPFIGAVPDHRWSAGEVINSPSKITYLGDFSGSDQLNLTLIELPPHRHALISFDLYIIGPWLGSVSPLGLWEFGENGLPALLTTTFCNTVPCFQSYPENYPLGSYPGRTGADGLDELGYNGTRDTRYHLYYELEHSAANLDLIFNAINLPAEAKWGLDNVQVRLDWSSNRVMFPVISR